MEGGSRAPHTDSLSSFSGRDGSGHFAVAWREQVCVGDAKVRKRFFLLACWSCQYVILTVSSFLQFLLLRLVEIAHGDDHQRDG